MFTAEIIEGSRSEMNHLKKTPFIVSFHFGYNYLADKYLGLNSLSSCKHVHTVSAQYNQF